MSQTEKGQLGEPPLIPHVELALPAKISARSGSFGSSQRKLVRVGVELVEQCYCRERHLASRVVRAGEAPRVEVSPAMLASGCATSNRHKSPEKPTVKLGWQRALPQLAGRPLPSERRAVGAALELVSAVPETCGWRRLWHVP
jgi:hypothetical protein